MLFLLPLFCSPQNLLCRLHLELGNSVIKVGQLGGSQIMRKLAPGLVNRKSAGRVRRRGWASGRLGVSKVHRSARRVKAGAAERADALGQSSDGPVGGVGRGALEDLVGGAGADSGIGAGAVSRTNVRMVRS